MSLPVLSWRDVVKALSKIGFEVVRQRGSHIIMVRSDPPSRVVVPRHEEIGFKLLGAIIEEAKLSRDEFLSLLK